VVGINVMQVGDRKQGINKYWPYHRLYIYHPDNQTLQLMDTLTVLTIILCQGHWALPSERSLESK